MAIYIKSSACVSPQHSINEEFPLEIKEYSGDRMKVVDPDYAQFINPKLVRRMSRLIKMGVASAMKTIKDANIENPDAIITGTGFGCLNDTEQFLEQMYHQNEQLLSPTAFIQSTHNTVSAQIALLLKCHSYNNTFVHRGFSFEHALLDARLMLEESTEDKNILLGTSDENTDISVDIFRRLKIFKRQDVSNLEALSHKSHGGISGEGAAFFLITNQPHTSNIAEIVDNKTIYKPQSAQKIINEINTILSNNNLSQDAIDLVIYGRNGDMHLDKYYDQVAENIFHDTLSLNYKVHCGEYPTSISYALWLATQILSKDNIGAVVKGANQEKPIQNILIYNHYIGIHHSLTLLKKA